MSKWYGSLQNRLEEGRQLVEEIKVGTGTIEKRVIRDENGFWREQIRFLPLEDWEPNDGWRTTYISSCPPEHWPEKRG